MTTQADVYVSAGEPEGRDARRPRGRPHRAPAGRPRRGAHHPHPRAGKRLGRRPVRPGRLRPRLRRAVRQAAAHRRPGARRPSRETPSRARWWWSRSRAGRRRPPAARPRHRGARAASMRPASTPRIIIRKHDIPDAHGDEAIEEARRLGAPCASATCAGRTDFRPRADRHDRRRARARLRRCDHARAAAERPLPAGRPHRRRVALRRGGQRARRGGVRARHVGLLPGARRPHVPGGARDRAVQPEPARRSARAVVPDGGRRARARSSATSSTTA